MTEMQRPRREQKASVSLLFLDWPPTWAPNWVDLPRQNHAGRLRTLHRPSSMENKAKRFGNHTMDPMPQINANEAISTLPRVATNKSNNSATLSRSNSIWSTMKKIATVSRPSVDTNSLSRHSFGSWSHIQNEDASAPKTDVFGFPLVEDAESQIRSLASQRLVETTRLSIWNRNVEYSPYWVGDELACQEAVSKGFPEVRKVGMNLVYEFPNKLSLVDRVSHGLPHAWRGYVWYYLITSTNSLTPAFSPEDSTAFDLDLVKEFHENNDAANNISYAEEIIQDPEATATVYPNRIHKLKRVLCALSQRDDKTGYVGSMVHVAAMLLLVMDEERAHIALVHLYGKANHASAVDLPSPDELRSWTPVTMRRTNKVASRNSHVHGEYESGGTVCYE
ncbi:hypothetical protein BJ741DRAFT_61147 [Chytriomyces cf. hyalinus JEL632]|nr:hypothetical protein BJ741DRAFT_61147 [Chytriomyces cf. hyalinus JEL632]